MSSIATLNAVILSWAQCFDAKYYFEAFRCHCLPNVINLSVTMMNVVAPELLWRSSSYRHDVDLAPLAVDGGSLSVADCRNGRFWNIIDRY
jgi:hypothetical protein